MAFPVQLVSQDCSGGVGSWCKKNIIGLFTVSALAQEAAVAFVGIETAAWIWAWGGIRTVARGRLSGSSWVVKLENAGVSHPFGSLTFGSCNSSKNKCAQASSGVSQELVYTPADGYMVQLPPVQFRVRRLYSPRMCLNLREFKFCVVWVHFSNLFPCWSSQGLDYYICVDRTHTQWNTIWQ